MQLQVQDESDSLYHGTTGPRNADILLVGEAWGADEERAQAPFVGSSGKELDRILADAGLSRKEILCANVVSVRPPGNDFTHFLYPNKEKVASYEGLKIKPALQDGLNRLCRLISIVQPRLLLAAGNIPLWALSHHAGISTKKGYKLPSGITSWRGSQSYSREILGQRYPLLPIIHPAAILREYGFRQITVQDLRRAKRYLDDPLTGWNPPSKTFTMHRPTFQQVLQRLHLWKLQLAEGPLDLSVDLETYRRRFISVVGLADSKLELCIPLLFKGKETIQSYFSISQEQEIWQELKLILEHHNVRIIGQNFIYDTEWFHRAYNITALVSFDTMVAHHLLFPGTPKRLDYLASLYCDHYCYWKDESGDWDTFPDDADRYWKYNCKDTRATYECAIALKAAIKHQGLEELYAYQMQQWAFSRKLCLHGINFDKELQKKMRLELMEEANELSEWLLSAVPEAWKYTSTGKPWFDSTKGTANLFYICLGITPILHKDTKRPTTNDAALAELSDRAGTKWLEPLLTRLRHLRSVGVFISHFLDAKPGVDGRFRCSFNIAHPETFRWSSNRNGYGEGTNLQNIPKGDEEPALEGETSELELEDEEDE